MSFLPKYALAAIPRYTSYPPATQFHDGIDGTQYRSWLEQVGPRDTLSIYVHIPFCQVLCWYCGCHTTVPNKLERVDRYVDTLLAETDLVSDAVPDNAGVVHIHFGGGTPNMLAPEVFSAIVQRLRDQFDVRAEAEVAVEIDPRGLSDAHIEAFARSGVTRASLGVQDVSAEVQKLINREQPLEVVRSAVDRLRAAGITALNLDLMYGLPRQTCDHIRRSADVAAELGADRIAVFGYAHVPWFKKHQRAIDESLLPGAEERFEQALASAEALKQHGYLQIGLDHFAKQGDTLAVAQQTGRLRRNFQGYTVDPADVLIGLGASSIGSFAQGYVQNEPHLLKYSEAIAAGRLPAVRSVTLTEDDRLRRTLIERLMCDFSVDVGAVFTEYGADSGGLPDLFDRFAPLVQDGLVQIDDGVVQATQAGRPYIRNAAVCFDAYHQESAARHSRAV